MAFAAAFSKKSVELLFESHALPMVSGIVANAPLFRSNDFLSDVVPDGENDFVSELNVGAVTGSHPNASITAAPSRS